MGITKYAQQELGDVVYIDLPGVGEKVKQKTLLTTIESIKAVSDIYAPVSGEVVEVNDDLQHSPELINQDPYGKGDRKSTRLNSSHVRISYAVFCLKKKK